MSPPYKYLEFYKKYNLSYWGSKIALLHNSYEHYDTIKETLTDKMEVPDHEKFKQMLKIELHFFYYQIAEALFELIFALDKRDEKYIWETISFSGYETYEKIQAISDGDDHIFNKTLKAIHKNNPEKILEIPFLKWVFFHNLDFSKVNSDLNTNLNKIKELLKIIADDFSIREEYNAFKHSLRFICDKPYGAIKEVNDDKILELSAKEGFGFLVKSKIDKNKVKVEEVIKSFSIEKDFKLCIYCSWLIHNIIACRRSFYFNTEDEIIFFDTIPLDKIFANADFLSEIRYTKAIYIKE